MLALSYHGESSSISLICLITIISSKIITAHRLSAMLLLILSSAARQRKQMPTSPYQRRHENHSRLSQAHAARNCSLPSSFERVSFEAGKCSKISAVAAKSRNSKASLPKHQIISYRKNDIINAAKASALIELAISQLISTSAIRQCHEVNLPENDRGLLSIISSSISQYVAMAMAFVAAPAAKWPCAWPFY